MIDDHGYEGNHINGFIDLTDKGIYVRQSFLYGPYGRDSEMSDAMSYLIFAIMFSFFTSMQSLNTNGCFLLCAWHP